MYRYECLMITPSIMLAAFTAIDRVFQFSYTSFHLITSADRDSRGGAHGALMMSSPSFSKR